MTMPRETIYFSDQERDTLYSIMRERRDMRHFLPNSTVEPAKLQRILEAAYMGPSVGLMQPWRFIRIRDNSIRKEVAELVEAERQLTAVALGERKSEFLKLKVEGVRHSAELLAVVQAPDDGTLFGRRTMPYEMSLCSTACAIENVWLAARAENLGMGWVSIFDPVKLMEVLKCPPKSKPIALLCLGPVKSFYKEPMLIEKGWRQKKPLENFLFDDVWGGKVQQEKDDDVY